MLVVVAGVIVAIVIMRNGIRRWRRLRSAAGNITWWQRIDIALHFMPISLIIFSVIRVEFPNPFHTTGGDYQAIVAYRTALQKQKVRLLPEVAGRYKLATDTLPTPNPAWYTNEKDRILTDSVLLAIHKSDHGRPLHVELTLQTDGTFMYLSNIPNDGTGHHVIGHWRMEASPTEEYAKISPPDIHDYDLVFYGDSSIYYNQLHGSLSVHTGQAKVTIAGTYQVQNHNIKFPLKRVVDSYPEALWK